MFTTDFGYQGDRVITMKVPTELWKAFENGDVLMNWSYMGDNYGIEESDFLDSALMFANKDHLAEIGFEMDDDTYGTVMYDCDYDQSFIDYGNWNCKAVNEIDIVDTYMKDDIEYNLIVVSILR